MEIKVVYIIIHDATVERYFSMEEVFQHRGKNIDVPWAGGWGNAL